MISYTITVCNEDKDLNSLLRFLSLKLKGDDEIVVQMDSMAVTNDVRNVIESHRKMITNFKVIEFPLDKDFAQFKNNLKDHCSQEWIFNIDADELPSGELIENLHQILSDNTDVDMILVPRWNLVDGITDDHVKKWGWKVDNIGRINWPDYQTRIYKNKKEILWKNKVHERLTGYDTYSAFPEEKEFCLFHNKTIERQETQNKFYEEIHD
jgi:glycosyltransferase involved in cell wall biosynthesis